MKLLSENEGEDKGIELIEGEGLVLRGNFGGSCLTIKGIERVTCICKYIVYWKIRWAQRILYTMKSAT